MHDKPFHTSEKCLPEWAVLIKRLYEEAQKDQAKRIKKDSV